MAIWNIQGACRLARLTSLLGVLGAATPALADEACAVQAASRESPPRVSPVPAKASLRVAVGNTASISRVIWSADGERLEAQAENGRKLWHVASGALLDSSAQGYVDNDTPRLEAVQPDIVVGAGCKITQTVLSPTQRWSVSVVVQGRDEAKAAGLWLVDRQSRGSPKRLLWEPGRAVRAIAFNPTETALAVASRPLAAPFPDKEPVVIYGLPHGGAVGRIEAESALSWLGYATGDELFYNSFSTVERVNVRTGARQSLKDFDDAELDASGTRIALVPRDRESEPSAVIIRDPQTLQTLFKIPRPVADQQAPQRDVTAMAWAPGKPELALGFSDGSVSVWAFQDKPIRVADWEANGGWLYEATAFDRAGKWFAVAGKSGIELWNLQDGSRRILRTYEPWTGRGSCNYDTDVGEEDGRFETWLSFTADDRTLLAASIADGRIDFWDVDTWKVRSSIGYCDDGPLKVSVDPQGRFMADLNLPEGQKGFVYEIELRRAKDGKFLRSLGSANPVTIVRTLPGDAGVVVGTEHHGVEIYSVKKGGESALIDSIPTDGDVADVAVDDAGRWLAIALREGLFIHDLTTRRSRELKTPAGGAVEATFIVMTPDARMLASVGDTQTELWDPATGRHIGVVPDRGANVQFAASGARLLVHSDHDIRYWDISDPAHPVAFARLLGRPDLDPVTLALEPRFEGRFDAGDLSAVRGLAWRMSDRPYAPLRLEAFMRDYYEPRLLERLIACRDRARLTGADACGATFGDAPAITDLNRIPPQVKITAITPQADGSVAVQVEGLPAADASQTNGRVRTDAYDLRLFRDGQLVGRCPAAASGIAATDRAAWRAATRIDAPCKVTVKLPASADPVAFSAYAFNEDRVKSDTVEVVWPRGRSPTTAPVRRAFIISIGVDAYAGDGAADLAFAARDARALAKSLQRLADYQVIPVVLTSEKGRPSTASKAHLRAVLSVLAGDDSARARLSNVEGARRLAAATPDDLVVVTFAGHGFTAPDRGFYLLGSDSDPTRPSTRDILSGYISSEDLGAWMESIDARQIVFIIDACHSAASVEQPGFKPGPMGDPGLGQLAYDKGMRILAATQVDDVALESERLKQGLLTYVLAQEAFRDQKDGKPSADLDRDGRLTLAEWLRYGEQQTPIIYEDIRAGRRRAVVARDTPGRKRDPVITGASAAGLVAQAQKPALFDYARLPPSAEPRLR